MLDIGCGDGSWLLTARERGFNVTGTELNPSLARAAGLEVFESLDEVRGRFDVITLWHSLEHMRDPSATIARASSLLSDGGWLFVAVPDAQGLQASVFGPRWFHLEAPRHRVHFSREGMRRLLARAGFDVVRLSTGSSATGLPASIQYVLFGRCLFPSGLPWRVASGIAAGFWPVAVVLDVVGGGDLLHVVGRKVVDAEQKGVAEAR